MHHFCAPRFLLWSGALNKCILEEVMDRQLKSSVMFPRLQYVATPTFVEQGAK